MRLFLRAHGHCVIFILIPKPRFLGNLPAAFNHADVPFDLVFQRLLQEAKRIQILHFDLRSEFLRAAQPHAHVRIAAQ